MKRSIIILLILTSFSLFSQENPTIYNPNADAKADLKNAIARAKAENKHVLIQVGGNWCSWCIKFHKFATTEFKIDSIIKSDMFTSYSTTVRRTKTWMCLRLYKTRNGLGSLFL